jgi:hypothetical protein
MTWDELFSQWSALEAARRRQDAQLALRDARKRVASNDDADWQWLTEALADSARKYFVAGVFRFQPVPKRLFAAFIQAAVLDVNYSNNRLFLRPCIESFGRELVLAELDRLRDSGTATPDMHRAGMYWLGQVTSPPQSGEEVSDAERELPRLNYSPSDRTAIFPRGPERPPSVVIRQDLRIILILLAAFAIIMIVMIVWFFIDWSQIKY